MKSSATSNSKSTGLFEQVGTLPVKINLYKGLSYGLLARVSKDREGSSLIELTSTERVEDSAFCFARSANAELAKLSVSENDAVLLKASPSRAAVKIAIHYPSGDLFKDIIQPDADLLTALRKLTSDGDLLELVLAYDNFTVELTPVVLHSYLIPGYVKAGFEPISVDMTGADTSATRSVSDSHYGTKHIYILLRARPGKCKDTSFLK